MLDKLQWRFLFLGVLGFFSGLPLALTGATLSAWLADAHVDRASIGLFAAVATPYAFKFLWAPLMDGMQLPGLTKRFGRRRGWLLLVQALLVAALFGMSGTNPAENQMLTALMAVLVAALSATQDTVIDAYRVEVLPAEDRGTGAAWATFGYRAGMLLSSAGALILADHVGWQVTYLAFTVIMAGGLIATLIAREPEVPEADAQHPAQGIGQFMREYVVAPIADFMTRPHWAMVLLFVVLYRLADAFMGVMLNPFLMDIGFTKTQIATIVKLYGVIGIILGTFAGGWMIKRMGIFRTLFLSGFFHMLTNFLMVVQAHVGANMVVLGVAITLENFTGGMSTAASLAYLAGLCRLHYTATQYALLSSLAAFGRTWLSTPSGWLAKNVGWEWFFFIASLLAIPGLTVLWWLERQQKKKLSTEAGATEKSVA